MDAHAREGADTVITVQNLRKEYGEFEALKGISFDVPKGQIVGFLGPNGAGKSTTMKILTCFMSASEGSVTVDGLDAYSESTAVKAKIGYLPESTPLYSDMIAYEYLEYVAAMRGIAASEHEERIRNVAATCGLKTFIGQEIGTLSKGQRQRVGLAQALIHDPPILILDEPTSGLDPNQIVEIRSLIRSLGKDRTIILSTHNLPEVMETCDRLIVIHQGEIVADGTAQELEEREATNPQVFLTIRGDSVDGDPLRNAIAQLDGVAAVRCTPGIEQRWTATIETNGSEDIRPALFRLAVEQKWELIELKRDALDLEGIFRKLTQAA